MNDTVKMAASHPNHPVLTGEEIVGLSNQLTRLIELCGASTELTTAVTAASDLGFHMHRFTETAQVIEIDRDIKAANLQLLVEKVLAYDALDRGTVDEIDAAYKDMVDLARSLKQ